MSNTNPKIITPYPDQAELIVSVYRAIAKGYKRILVRAETGAGKTVIASKIMQDANKKGWRCAFQVPRKELLRQTGGTLFNFGVDFSFIAAGNFYDEYAQNQLCSMQTLCNRLHQLKGIQLLFIDETHFGAGQMQRIVEHCIEHDILIIGLSATPEKQNGKPMGDWYEVMVEGKDLAWLIENKRLSDYRMFAVSRPNLDGVKVTNGEYQKRALSSVMEQDRVIIGDAVTHYKNHAMGKRHLTFTVSVKQSRLMAEAFNAAGVPTAHMDGDTPDAERKRIIKAFADGELLNICSVDLLLFGFDLSAQVGRDVPVESMSDCRPTRSRNVQRQKVGRVLRYKPYPALIFDHAGNAINADGTPNHGLPCTPQVWTLEGRKIQKRGERQVQMRNCERCFMLHEAAPVCPNCGYKYPTQPKADPKQVAGELVEIQKIRQKEEMRREEHMCETLEDWQQLAQQRGHNQKWANIRYTHSPAKKRKDREAAAAFNEPKFI